MRALRDMHAWLRRFCGALALAATAGAAAAAEPTTHAVQDPHYGDTLFHFYQEQYFTALVGLMVSQRFDRVAHHADEAEVLRGGLLLSYGMPREAGEVFARLIDNGAAPAVRDRAWFYLAKIRYQRGQFAEANEAMARVAAALPEPLQEQRLLLRADILLALGDYSGAARLLADMTTHPRAGRYARYNLGVAMVKGGEAAAGSEVLDELGRAGAPDEELRSLRDRTNVALGFSALQQQQPEAARKYLARVRLASAQSGKALLGYGWAAAALKQPRQALVPWTELLQRDGSDAAVLEARLAVPYAFAEIGAYGQALQHYNEAIAAFEREHRQLDASIAAIRSGKLLDGLAERNPGADMGWFWSLNDLPDAPHVRQLAPLLAQHAFQEGFKNYRDLQFLQRNLQQWQDNLGVFGDMLANRRKAYLERLPRVRAQAQDSGLVTLQGRRDALAGELGLAEARTDGTDFADARQRDLLARLQSVRAALDAMGTDPTAPDARERWRLASGALTWELAQQLPQRRWEAKKALAATDRALEESAQRGAALDSAQRAEPLAFDVFGERIAELDKRIRTLQPQLAALRGEQQAALQELAVAELALQKQRLVEYVAQARFAVAQLYDRATLAQESTRANP
jgi:hypothetical protein